MPGHRRDAVSQPSRRRRRLLGVRSPDVRRSRRKDEGWVQRAAGSDHGTLAVERDDGNRAALYAVVGEGPPARNHSGPDRRSGGAHEFARGGGGAVYGAEVGGGVGERLDRPDHPNVGIERPISVATLIRGTPPLRQAWRRRPGPRSRAARPTAPGFGSAHRYRASPLSADAFSAARRLFTNGSRNKQARCPSGVTASTGSLGYSRNRSSHSGPTYEPFGGADLDRRLNLDLRCATAQALASAPTLPGGNDGSRDRGEERGLRGQAQCVGHPFHHHRRRSRSAPPNGSYVGPEWDDLF